MDIIASHRWGLIEQLEAEADGLAGRAGDSRQRAIVWYHLSDCLGHHHDYALLAAGASLALEPRIEALHRTVRQLWRAPWVRLGRGERDALGERVEQFGAVCRELDRQRCHSALLAYRLMATPGLGDAGRARLDPDLVRAFEPALRARASTGTTGSSMTHDERRALFEAHRRGFEVAAGSVLDEAVAALDWRLSRASIIALVETLSLPATAFERLLRRGSRRAEQAVRASRSLPAGFGANPSQSYFKLQRQLAERRRRERVGDGPVEGHVRIAA